MKMREAVTNGGDGIWKPIALMLLGLAVGGAFSASVAALSANQLARDLREHTLQAGHPVLLEREANLAADIAELKVLMRSIGAKIDSYHAGKK